MKKNEIMKSRAKKGLLAALVGASIVMSCTGCEAPYILDRSNLGDMGGRFTVVETWRNDNDDCFSIVYDNDTKVEYLIIDSSYYHNLGITPLYNADSSVKIYKE
jgi:hypothetical protein